MYNYLKRLNIYQQLSHFWLSFSAFGVLFSHLHALENFILLFDQHPSSAQALIVLILWRIFIFKPMYFMNLSAAFSLSLSLNIISFFEVSYLSLT